MVHRPAIDGWLLSIGIYRQRKHLNNTERGKRNDARPANIRKAPV